MGLPAVQGALSYTVERGILSLPVQATNATLDWSCWAVDRQESAGAGLLHAGPLHGLVQKKVTDCRCLPV